MGSVAQLQQQLGGFDFSLHERNVNLLKKAEAARVAARECSQGSSQGGVSASGVPAGLRLPPLRKTGTTICGVIFNGGVVLGADTRATQGSVIADKNCSKLHKIHNNIFAAGAGTSADLDHTTHWLSAQVELHRLNTRSKTPRVSMAVCALSQKLFQYQGYIGCAIVLGGVDCRGPSLYNIHPHGSTDTCSYAAMGSGSLNAMAVLEAGFKDGLTEEEALALVSDAITAGVKNDLGSGGSVDVCVITKEGYRHIRSHRKPAREAFKAVYPPFARGTTPVFSQQEEPHAPLPFQVQVEDVVEMQED